MIEITPTELRQVLIIKPIFYDKERGFFMENYHQTLYDEAGITSPFIQKIMEKYSGSEQMQLREIKPILSSEFAGKAMCPDYSVLDLSSVQSCLDLNIQS